MKCFGWRLAQPFALFVLVAVMPACENKEITQPDPQPSAVGSDGKLEPLPSPIGRTPGPAAPGVGSPAAGASPSPTPGGPSPITGGPPSTTPSPTPSPGSSPDPTISVVISGPRASDFEVVKIPETADRTVYKDETWTTALSQGMVLIRTTNARKGDLGNPQATLAITASAPVVALLVHDNPDAIGWDDAQGFQFIGESLHLDTPTPTNPGAANVFLVKSRKVGLSANITLGSNYETPAPATCQADRACQPMYFLIITRE